MLLFKAFNKFLFLMPWRMQQVKPGWMVSLYISFTDLFCLFIDTITLMMPLVMCSITNCAHVVAEIPFNKGVVQSDDKLSRNQYFSDYNNIVKVHTFSVQHLTDQCMVIDRKTMCEQHLLKSVSLKSNALIIAQLKFELRMLLFVN